MINRSLKAGALITNSTSIDIFNFNDYSAVIKVLNDKVIAKTKAGKTHTINLRLDEAFYWHECDKNGVSAEVKYDLETIRERSK